MGEPILGEIPELWEIPPGYMLSLRTGKLTSVSDYASSTPAYPDYPDDLVWNPGGLLRDGMVFRGWSTRPYGFPVYMLSRSTSSISVYPVWGSANGEWENPGDGTAPPTRERPYPATYTTKFIVPKMYRSSFTGFAPEDLTLVYGSELDLVGYGASEMSVAGYHFAGWSISPIFPEIIPRLSVIADTALYAVFYPVVIPRDQPKTYDLTFVSGDESTTIKVNHSSVIRVVGYIPPGLSHIAGGGGEDWEFVGWTESPEEADRLLCNAKPSERPFHVKMTGDKTLYTVWNLNPSQSGNPSTSEPPTLEQPPPVQPCDVEFSLTAQGGPRLPEKTVIDDSVKLAALRSQLVTPLENSTFWFKQQFLKEAPRFPLTKADFRDKQTFCEEPHIPDYEKLELWVDNSETGNPEHTWTVPVGGLTSSGASALLDWDIWVDYRYMGRYTGYSGLRAKGITLDLNPEVSGLATGLKVTPRYKRYDREKPVSIDIQVTAEGDWRCIPYYVHMTDDGDAFTSGLGIFEDFLKMDKLGDVNYGNRTIHVSSSRNPVMEDRLLQGFIFYPAGRQVRECALSMVLLDFVSPERMLAPLILNRSWVNVEYPCEAPLFNLVTSQLEMVYSNSLTDKAKCILGSVVREALVPRPVTNALPSLLRLGARLHPKEVTHLAAVPSFNPYASAVRVLKRPTPMSAAEHDKLRCKPYEVSNVAKITIRPHWKAPRFYGWLRAFAFGRDSVEKWNTIDNKNKLLQAEMRITPLMFCDSATDAGNYCMRYLFYECRRMQLGGRFTFHSDWDTVLRAGNDFMAHAFKGCIRLKSFPPNYNEPQALQQVGNDFKAYKCQGCRYLTSLGTSLSPPPNLTRVGHGFEVCEYADCPNLMTLPEKYSEPAKIYGEPPYDYQMFKFLNSSSLRTLPSGFKETAFIEVGNNYLAYKYQNSGLRYLPDKYSPSYALTHVGDNCQVGTFDGCSGLVTLPAGYTEIAPSTIGNNFLKYKFRGCTSLVVPMTYTFPEIGDSVSKRGVFEKTFPDSSGVAINIVNGNQEPPDRRYTFSNKFTDYSSLAGNWK